jgi:cell filamentation protein
LPKLESFSERDDFLDGVADSFCEINLLHPFREGNGRVQRFFFEEMLFVLGYDVTWPKISREQWLDANIAGVNLNLAPLKDIFDQALNAR